MPRVKLIYVGDGEWIRPTADFATCSHPRDRLRFDPRFGLPVSTYCMACGRAYIHPLHGLTQEEIDERRRVVQEKFGHWFTGDEEAA